MDAAFELGINVFDTADAYGGGRSESAIGKWLAKRGSAVRDQVLLSTKAFNPVGDGPNDRGLSRRRARPRRRREPRAARRRAPRPLPLPRARPGRRRSRRRSARSTTCAARASCTTSARATSRPGGWRAASGSATCAASRASSGCSRATACSTARPRPRCCRCAPMQGLGFSPFSPLSGGWLTGKYRRDQAAPAGSRMTLRSEPYEHLKRARGLRRARGPRGDGEGARRRHADARAGLAARPSRSSTRSSSARVAPSTWRRRWPRSS